MTLHGKKWASSYCNNLRFERLQTKLKPLGVNSARGEGRKQGWLQSESKCLERCKFSQGTGKVAGQDQGTRVQALHLHSSPVRKSFF